MSDDTNPTRKSLAEEIKQRKAHELQRSIEAHKLERETGSAPKEHASTKPQPNVAPPPARTPTASPTKRTEHTEHADPLSGVGHHAVESIENVEAAGRKLFQGLSARQKTTLIAASAGLLILIVLGGTFFISSSSGGSVAIVGTPTLVPLGLANVDSVLQRFKDVKEPLTEIQPYDVTNSQVWNATSGYQFNIRRGADKGSFILLGYASAQQVSDDLSTMLGAGTFKNWQVNFDGNILLLASTDTTKNLYTEMFSHMKSYLLAPYLSFWPTATLVPSITPTPNPTVKATAKPPAAATAAATAG